MRILDYFLKANGFQDTTDFLKSTLHPASFPKMSIFAFIFSSLAYACENTFGASPYIILGMLLLFSFELITGIRASKKEGYQFDSHIFPKGWIKFFFYLTMICCAYLFSKHMDIKPIFGMNFNYWEWIHYMFVNLTMLNLFISNLQNAVRLGWGEYVPLIKKITKIMNIDTEPKKRN